MLIKEKLCKWTSRYPIHISPVNLSAEKWGTASNIGLIKTNEYFLIISQKQFFEHKDVIQLTVLTKDGKMGDAIFARNSEFHNQIKSPEEIK
jgi:hypothetical protein